MREKYASLGYFGGNIVLTDATEEEKYQLGGFVKKDYGKKSKITLSMELLNRSLLESKFYCFTWKQILEGYFNQELTINRQIKEERNHQKDLFFQTICEKYAGKKGRAWLDTIFREKEKGYYVLIPQYEKDKEGLEQILIQVLKAIERLPIFEDLCKRLPIFSAEITGNPHFFDDNTMAGKLLLYFLEYYFPSEEMKLIQSEIERKNYYFYKAGILRDDLSNMVLVYGIKGIDKEGKYHKGMEGYYERKEPIQLTLYTLQQLKEAYGNETIYVVENPAVFSMLIEKYPEISAICTNGQPRFSTLLLMDLLSKNSIFYYSGDFDPEGLFIAQKLKQRYKERLVLWNYDREHYEQMKSDVILTGKRLALLDNIICEELIPMKRWIQAEKKAGYQENVMWVI